MNRKMNLHMRIPASRRGGDFCFTWYCSQLLPPSTWIGWCSSPTPAFFVCANAAQRLEVANAGQSFVLALADAGALSWQQLAADWDLSIYIYKFIKKEQHLFPRETQSAAKQQLVPFFRPQVLSQMPSCIRRVLVVHVRVILASRGLKAWSCQLETSVLSLKKRGGYVLNCFTARTPALECYKLKNFSDLLYDAPLAASFFGIGRRSRGLRTSLYNYSAPLSSASSAVAPAQNSARSSSRSRRARRFPQQHSR